jgi:hypothetical protein
MAILNLQSLYFKSMANQTHLYNRCRLGGIINKEYSFEPHRDFYIVVPSSSPVAEYNIKATMMFRIS